MRPNIVTEAGLPMRLNQWWAGVPFITSSVVIVCGFIYLVCLLFGYDSFAEICFLPSEIVSHFQVYRIYTAVLFHGSLLHVAFNMLALVPLGTELERVMGSVRLIYSMLLLATTNGILHLFIALVAAHNPLHPYGFLLNECAIGFSGIIFSMIVIETSLNGVQSRSVFGLFNVPAQWYAWILLLLFQLLASNVSLLGHLCGILSGFAYIHGLLNYLLPGSSFYSAIESSSILSPCLRRPGFILCTGGTTYGQLPTFLTTSTTPSGLFSESTWRSLSSWMPRRDSTTTQPGQDPRFPGRGRALGAARNQSATEHDLNLQAGLLDNSGGTISVESTAQCQTQHVSDARRANATEEAVGAAGIEVPANFDIELQRLVAMGFEKTRAEVALAAADGDPTVAIEILMSQQG